jgi:hypothetical protein
MTLNITKIDCKEKNNKTINPQQIVLAARNRDGKSLREVTTPNPGVKIEFQAKPNDPISFSLTLHSRRKPNDPTSIASPARCTGKVRDPVLARSYYVGTARKA